MKLFSAAPFSSFVFSFFLPERFHNIRLSHLLSYYHNQGCVLSIFGDQPAFSVLTPFTACGKRWWGVFAKLFSLFKLSRSHKAKWVIVQRWGFPRCACGHVFVCERERLGLGPIRWRAVNLYTALKHIYYSLSSAFCFVFHHDSIEIEQCRTLTTTVFHFTFECILNCWSNVIYL